MARRTFSSKWHLQASCTSEDGSDSYYLELEILAARGNLWKCPTCGEIHDLLEVNCDCELEFFAAQAEQAEDEPFISGEVVLAQL